LSTTDKPKKEKLRLYGVRLRGDQIEFLKGLDDAAAVIRQLIDDYILKSGKPDVILIKRKIDILQRKISEVVNSAVYKACKHNTEQREKAKENPDITRWRLYDIRTLNPYGVEVNSEVWEKVIKNSVDVFNSFQSECRRWLKEIEALQAQLTTVPDQ